MPRHRVAASAVIHAPPQRVYEVLADYRVGHPAILPPKYFGPITVEAGGVGEGTVAVVEVRAGARTRQMRAHITEPKPGRVLVESYPDTGEVTTFVVDPAAGGARVSFTTELDARGGIVGLLERSVVSWFLGRVYRAELARLDDYVRN